MIKMNAKRTAAWFLSYSGKKFVYYTAGTVCTGVLFATFVPHTLLLEQYKDTRHLYKYGMTVPLSETLHRRFQKALDLVGVDLIEKHLFEAFPSSSFDIMSAGSSYSKFGVIVGLPANFFYDDVDMIDKSLLKVNHESISWESDTVQTLLNSLVLSENAQLYAMAREIKYRQTPKPMFDVFIATSSCLMAYWLGNHLNNKLNLFARPLGLRLIMYTLIGVFTFGIYSMSKDVTQVYYEEAIDKELKEKNRVFAEGGKEYYSKMLERNKALRKLMGKEGENLYSVLGNENYLFRTKHLPIIQRRGLFEETLSETLIS